MRPMTGFTSPKGRTAGEHPRSSAAHPFHPPTRAAAVHGQRTAITLPAVLAVVRRTPRVLRDRYERLLHPAPRVALWGGRSSDFQLGSPEDRLRADLQRRHPDLQLRADVDQWRGGLERLLADVHVAHADHITRLQLDAELEHRRSWAAALDVDLFGGDWPTTV